LRFNAKDPKSQLKLSGIWIVASILFLDTAWSKVMDLRAAHGYASPWRYAAVGFWVVVLCFHLGNVALNWRRFDANQTQSR
jgi:hypothetical protein